MICNNILKGKEKTGSGVMMLKYKHYRKFMEDPSKYMHLITNLLELFIRRILIMSTLFDWLMLGLAIMILLRKLAKLMMVLWRESLVSSKICLLRHISKELKTDKELIVMLFRIVQESNKVSNNNC